MDKQEIINELEKLKLKLNSDVLHAYMQRGEAFGEQRFQSFIRVLSRFLSTYLPENTVNFDELFSQGHYNRDSETDAEYFWRNEGILLEGLIDSLIIDVNDGAYDFTPINKDVKKVEITSKPKSKKVFIVHGHDEHIKERTARFIQKLGFEPIILHEQASGGSTTIIEKILEYAKTTDFAIVLYTADDVGGIKKTEPSSLKPRARQNVVFEHGLLIGLLGRENVVPLVADNIEIPNDISGVVYVKDDWQTAIAKEMKKAGYDIDFNKLF